MLDPGDLLDTPRHLLLAILRILWWLAWDFCFEIIGWSVGWLACRLLSFGKFPKEGISQINEANSSTAFLIEILGLAVIAIGIYLLSHAWP